MTPESTDHDPDELMTGGRASAYSGISRARLYTLANQKRIGQKIGGVWFFTPRELDAYKESEKSKGGRPKSESPITSPVIRLAA